MVQKHSPCFNDWGGVEHYQPPSSPPLVTIIPFSMGKKYGRVMGTKLAGKREGIPCHLHSLKSQEKKPPYQAGSHRLIRACLPVGWRSIAFYSKKARPPSRDNFSYLCCSIEKLIEWMGTSGDIASRFRVGWDDDGVVPNSPV